METRNLLLNACAGSDRLMLMSQLERVDLPAGFDIERPHERIDFVYFYEDGIASIISIGPSGDRMEAGIVGREGMTGCAVLHGTDRSPLHTLVQVPGHGLRIPAEQFRKVIESNATLKSTLLLYSQSKFVQVTQTARSNGRNAIEQRLAGWILMCQDRIGGPQLEMTHEFLSVLLGVRRAGITSALHILEGKHAIRSSRGMIGVRDRAQLRQIAGDSYGTAEAEYERLLGCGLAWETQGATALTELA